jgi:signal peptidase I
MLSGLKTFIIALILALLVRVFVFEIFKIPSCSMEPTLVGIDLSHGDRVGVNKLAYLFGDINRYDVVVFSTDTFIEGRKVRRDYIKRVAGLPGEELTFEAGDLYANGKIAPKPEDVQETVWIPVYSEEFENASWQRFWRSEGGKLTANGGVLSAEGGKISYIHWERVLKNGENLYSKVTNLVPRLPILEEVICPGDSERFVPQWRDLMVETDVQTGEVRKGFICPRCGAQVLYEGRPNEPSQPLVGVPGTDFWLGGTAIVGDLAFEADITPKVRSGSVKITISRGSEGAYYDPHTVELPIGPEGKPLYRSLDRSEPLSELSRLQADKTARVSFHIWDGQVLVRVDGTVVLKTSFLPSTRPLDGNGITITLGDSTRVDMDNVAIRRDLYYLEVDMDPKANPMFVSKGKYRVPDGHYFMLGDNSAASNDNRVALPPVSAADIVGRGFAIIWPFSHGRWLPSRKE